MRCSCARAVLSAYRPRRGLKAYAVTITLMLCNVRTVSTRVQGEVTPTSSRVRAGGSETKGGGPRGTQRPRREEDGHYYYDKSGQVGGVPSAARPVSLSLCAPGNITGGGHLHAAAGALRLDGARHLLFKMAWKSPSRTSWNPGKRAGARRGRGGAATTDAPGRLHLY